MLYRLALALLLSSGLFLTPVVEPVKPAMAASKKKPPLKRSDLTPEQREKVMEYARALCKKKYGASARVYRIDYAKRMVWCRPPGS